MDRHRTRGQLYAEAMMLLPQLLPTQLKLAGIDELFVSFGAEKHWLKKGYPKLWETQKGQRVREWLEGIQNYEPDRLLPMVLEVLQTLIYASPSIPAVDKKHAVVLHRQIELHLGIAPPSQRPMDPRIWSVIEDSYRKGEYAEATRKAIVELVNEVKKKSRHPVRNNGEALDGAKLMDRVFSVENPILQVSTDKDRQIGITSLFKGLVGAYRNPLSHANGLSIDQDEANTIIWMVENLLRTLDGATLMESNIR